MCALEQSGALGGGGGGFGGECAAAARRMRLESSPGGVAKP